MCSTLCAFALSHGLVVGCICIGWMLAVGCNCGARAIVRALFSSTAARFPPCQATDLLLCAAKGGDSCVFVEFLRRERHRGESKPDIALPPYVGSIQLYILHYDDLWCALRRALRFSATSRCCREVASRSMRVTTAIVLATAAFQDMRTPLGSIRGGCLLGGSMFRRTCIWIHKATQCKPATQCVLSLL